MYDAKELLFLVFQMEKTFFASGKVRFCVCIIKKEPRGRSRFSSLPTSLSEILFAGKLVETYYSLKCLKGLDTKCTKLGIWSRALFFTPYEFYSKLL